MVRPPHIDVASYLPAHPSVDAEAWQTGSQNDRCHITSYGLSAFTSRSQYSQRTQIDVADSLQRVHFSVWLRDGVEIEAEGCTVRAPGRGMVMGLAPDEAMRTMFGGHNDHVGLLVPVAQLYHLGEAQAQRCTAFLQSQGGLSAGAGSGRVLKAAHELDTVLRNASSSKLLLEAKSLELLAVMLDDLDAGSSQQPRPAGRQLAALRRAKEVLLADLARSPSIEELARVCGLNTFQLKQGFKQVFGVSVHACYQQERMQRAWELIESGQFNATEAGRQVGYINASHFGVAFRKVFGVLPSELRRRLTLSGGVGGKG